MKYLFIILFVSLFYNPFIYSQGNWTNFTTEDNINDILIDSNLVWVGSQGGLTCTNLETGEFKALLAGNSPIVGGGISEIEKHPDGSLWFGSENAGIFNLKNGEWTQFYQNIVTDEYENISNLQITKDGDVWFFEDKNGSQINNKLFRIRNGNIKSFDNLPNYQNSFYVVDQNTLYMTFGNNLIKYDIEEEKVIYSYGPENSIISKYDEFRDIITDKKGNLILTTKERILQLKNDTLSIISTPGVSLLWSFKDDNNNIFLQPYLDEPNGIRLIKYDGEKFTYIKDHNLSPFPIDKTPIFYSADASGSIYAGFYDINDDRIIFKFDGSKWTHIRTQIKPLLSNHLDDVKSDCNGNIWFTGVFGTDVKNYDETWQRIKIPYGENKVFIPNYVCFDTSNCDIWLTSNYTDQDTERPGLIRISGNDTTTFLTNVEDIYSIVCAKNGRVYFYSASSGYGYIENDVEFFINEFKKYEPIRSMVSDKESNIYLASYKFGLIKFDGKSFTYLGSGEGSNSGLRVFIDNDGFIWLTTNKGLMQYDGLTWHNYTDVWPKSMVNGMIQDKKGNYWVSTWKDGLFYWNKNSTQKYNILNSGLNTNHLSNVGLDHNGNLMVASSNGASFLEIPYIQLNYRGTGTVFFDSDKNGIYNDSIDILMPGQKVTDIELNSWAITNSMGQYRFYSNQSSNHQYELKLEPNAESTTDNPNSGNIYNSNSNLPDFGFWKEYNNDVNIEVTNFSPICNREFKVQINLQNKNAKEISGILKLSYSNGLTFIKSSIPVKENSNSQITFDPIYLNSLQGQNIKLIFKAPGIEEDETEIYFNAVFETDGISFTDSTSDIVQCSYDPNNKKVEPTGHFKDNTSLIADPLKYTIRFQNKGTYNAFDITIIDTLDSNFDPSSFNLLASSHDVETNIASNGIITFFFRNINLPPKSEDEVGSQGFVSFSINTFSNVNNNQEIRNAAGIFFDFNLPIFTNLTKWYVAKELPLNFEEKDIIVYPNPFRNQFHIQSKKENIKEVRVQNIIGYSVYNEIYNDPSLHSDIEISSAPSGIYLVNIVTINNDIISLKIIKK